MLWMAYRGFHYPTYLLAGPAIGVAITYLMTRDALRRRTAAPILRWTMRQSGTASPACTRLSVSMIWLSVTLDFFII
jgi:hypothetical protein